MGNGKWEIGEQSPMFQAIDTDQSKIGLDRN